MEHTVLAIDPGTSGAMAILDGDSVTLEPMPQLKEGGIDYPELLRLLRHYAPKADRIGIEKPYLPPGQNVVNQLKHIGRIEGMLIACGCPFETIPAVTWSEMYPHGVTLPRGKARNKAIKVARRLIAAQLYPGIDLRKNARATVPHDGIVDALLLADFLMNQAEGRLL